MCNLKRKFNSIKLAESIRYWIIVIFVCISHYSNVQQPLSNFIFWVCALHFGVIRQYFVYVYKKKLRQTKQTHQGLT